MRVNKWSIFRPFCNFKISKLLSYKYILLTTHFATNSSLHFLISRVGLYVKGNMDPAAQRQNGWPVETQCLSDRHLSLITQKQNHKQQVNIGHKEVGLPMLTLTACTANSFSWFGRSQHKLMQKSVTLKRRRSASIFITRPWTPRNVC